MLKAKPPLIKNRKFQNELNKLKYYTENLNCYKIALNIKPDGQQLNNENTLTIRLFRRCPSETVETRLSAYGALFSCMDIFARSTKTI